MQFIDEAKIFIQSGHGGNGCVSFRRERNIPFGGPNGGHGGRGGSIIFEATSHLNTLIDFRYQQHFKAQKGQHGMGSDCDGVSGEDMLIKVPVGTQIFEEDKETLLADLVEEGQRVVLAKGGNGGLGNTHFKSSTNRAPRQYTPGGEGEEKWVWLKLKLLSDAGLVGLPNAGKSTFLSAVSRARPKVADYPFTTLKPHLGVVYVNEKEFVLADLPGLIEGASEGAGLGTRFLGHVERCRVILHLVDGTQEDVAAAYTTIRGELEAYGHGLAEKEEIVALNKCDALSEEERKTRLKALKKAAGKDARVFVISGVTGEGVQEVLSELLSVVEKARNPGHDDEEEGKPYDPLGAGK